MQKRSDIIHNRFNDNARYEVKNYLSYKRDNSFHIKSNDDKIFSEYIIT